MTGRCDLCHVELAPRDGNLVAQLSLCDRCHAGDFRPGLRARGIAFQQLTYTYRQGGAANKTATWTEIQAALAYDLQLRVKFTSEGAVSKLLKPLSSEIQTGDRAFDDAVLIKTEQRERVAEMLASPGVRAAVMEAVFEETVARRGGIEITGNRCSIRDPGSGHDDPPDWECRRSLAVLFHHLQVAAEDLGLARNLDRLGFPDLDPLHDAIRWGLLSVTLRETTCPDLEPFRHLQPAMDQTSVSHLALCGCPILSGDISPLADLDWLRSLVITRAPQVEDITPLARLASLTALSLSRTSVRELSPIAGLTDLQQLNLRGLTIPDLGPVLGLRRLRKIWLEDAVVDPSQVEELRRRNPDLVFVQG